jgi:hypothetical protein
MKNKSNKKSAQEVFADEISNINNHHESIVKHIRNPDKHGIRATLDSVKKSKAVLEGNKFDKEKVRYDLLPLDALEEIGKVFTMGSKKYGDRNWEKGMSWGRLFAAALRHLFAFWMGEDYDKESGLFHTSHAAWNVIALLMYQKRKVGIDDRTKVKGV